MTPILDRREAMLQLHLEMLSVVSLVEVAPQARR